ncbi:putative co-chaperone Hsc20 [Magnetofaba australis IT-1]|uniref:Co-chaperone protein HscB homolog n=1 Tax=Magnetofaba australis IT-1 TaxID=1434232 RepID=A0A1Y2K422_9PROT|nr:putative co-chaperone Hsc20 [Magnetofaba australis IT-1]
MGDAPFCPTCNAIQPPNPKQDHFDFLGLPRGYEVDVAALESAGREWQQKLHPDRFAAKSATERRFSLEQATRLNDAMQALKDPLRRAEYLLSQSGVSRGEGTGSGAQDPMFLMEVMELREALSEVDMDADDAMDRLDSLRDQVEQHADAEVEALRSAFADMASPDVEAASVHADRLRYHQRFLEEVDRMEEQLF